MTAPPMTCVAGTLGCGPVATAGASGALAGSGGTAPGIVGTAGMAGGIAGSSVVDPGGVPCDVAAIVSERCTGCHQSPTKFGATMPLLSLADFQAESRLNPGKKVYEVIPERLAPADPSRRMPQPPLPALSVDEQGVLTAWMAAAAPAASNACPITITEVPTVDMMGTPSTGMGGAHIDPIEYDDPDMQCYKFLAHASGDKNAPYMATREEYVNFDFAAPWTGKVYLRATRLANDPSSHVIHHWLLFKQAGAVIDGAIGTGTGVHPDGTLIHAWGPGASPIYLDPDLGVELDDTVGYRLEAHFNTSSGPGPDQSGGEVCVTPHEPEHLAELVWVGSDSILGTSATGRCSPRGPFPIHVIAAQPHMHKLGTHMKVTVNRATGAAEVVHDMDFVFDSQQYYVKNFVLEEGDTMTTECSYSGFASFGTSTNSEMCYFFSLAWPAGALRGGGGALIHGPNSCM